MHKPPTTTNIFLLSIIIVLILSSFINKPSCIKTPDGRAIDWQKKLKLTRDNFKATKNLNYGNSVASTYSGFGYEITDNDGEISGSIFVRFYCGKSWFSPKIKESDKITYILQHEQLHFDICELFGRKLHKEIMELINSNKFNQRTVDRIQAKLEKQYSYYQKVYDKETNHSINTTKQQMWNKKIKMELSALSNYSDYQKF